MSLEESFKIVIAILLGVLSWIGSRIANLTFQNTRAIDRLTSELEHVRKYSERITSLESDVRALNQSQSVQNGHHKGNGK